MLSRANRIVLGEDYRSVVRRGRRTSTPNAVVYTWTRNKALPPRFGFIVSKAVGNAVMRNLVRRRLKAIASELLPDLTPGTDVVVRALPVVAHTSWVTLRAEISSVVNKGMASV